MIKFITGNEAVVLGAQKAGAVLMCGYPITPATEILQEWAELSEKNKKYQIIQAEDEISAGFNVIGGLIAGKKCFTATAGMGNVLMQDALSMAEAMRMPFVEIVMQRGGPSTGTVIYGQQEVTLSCFGGNGEGHRIVYSVDGIQELYEYTIKAFYNAWKYKFPVVVLGDGYQSKTFSKLDENINYKVAESHPIINENNINQRNCYNIESELAQKLALDRVDYIKASLSTAESFSYKTNDAKKIVIGHGILSGSIKEAVDEARQKGKKVGFFRPITLRPLDVESLNKAVKNANEILIAESSYGHLFRIIKSGLSKDIKIKTLYKPVEYISKEEIIKYL